jgi:RNA ligase (TIGR02306 family)
MAERKLASIQIIQEIKAIPEADLICAYRINGWWVVSKVNEFRVGDKVVFLEVDSWVPTELAPFLSKGKEPKEYNGIKGERLRTVRLKRQLSQGLILPFEVLEVDHEGNIGIGDWHEHDDVTAELGIIKWEPPLEYISADAKGNFPSFVPKTDQERIQNCYGDLSKEFQTMTWEVTEKNEGQSFTAYLNDGEFGVCSRNLDLKDGDNTFWNTARKYDIERKLRELNLDIAIQGEQYGIGISGNIYKLDSVFLHVFDIFCIKTRTYYSPKERQELCDKLQLEHVPILEAASVVTESLDELLVKADAKSVIGDTGTLREGITYKANSKERITFKVVSNEYLLKTKG